MFDNSPYQTFDDVCESSAPQRTNMSCWVSGWYEGKDGLLSNGFYLKLHLLFLKAVLILPVSSRTCFYSVVLMELWILAALRTHCCCLIRTQRAGPWQQNKQTIQEMNLLISNSSQSDHPESDFQPVVAHRAQGLLRVQVHYHELFVHGEDINQVHGVGAL